MVEVDNEYFENIYIYIYIYIIIIKSYRQNRFVFVFLSLSLPLNISVSLSMSSSVPIFHRFRQVRQTILSVYTKLMKSLLDWSILSGLYVVHRRKSLTCSSLLLQCPAYLFHIICMVLEMGD